MPSLKGRRFFFATAADLRPGLEAIEDDVDLDFVLHEMSDTPTPRVFGSLRNFPELGVSATGAATTSPMFLVFPRGKVPRLSAIKQRKGGTRYVVAATADCVILHCGGVHPTSGAIVAGELQLPLSPSATARELFQLFSRELFGGFHTVRDFRVGPEAFSAFKSGERLVSIGVRSPREYDLTEP